MCFFAKSADWARVYGRMQAKQAAKLPPPLTPWHEPEALLYPGLSTHPFHEPTDPWWCDRVASAVALLERFYPVIRDEFLMLANQRLQQYQKSDSTLLHEHGDWNVHYLLLEGTDTSLQRRQTPKTAKIVSAISRQSGHAFFSVLDPGTHILPHCGPSNYRLRLQLGLCIPHGCSIRVGDQTRTWVEGKCLVLDDAFEHEVWNTSEHKRIILLVDIWHPDFSDKEIGWMEQTRAWKRRQVGGNACNARPD